MPERLPEGLSLDALLQNPQGLDVVPREALPGLLADLEALRARAWLRLTLPREAGSPPISPPSDGGDRLLTATEAARLLGVAPRWLYRRASKLPFTRRLGRKVVRFDEAALHRWAASRR